MGLLIGSDGGILSMMPTVVHALLVASVPAINLGLWICIRSGKVSESGFLRAFCGFAVGVCAVYTLMLLPLIAIGILFALSAFWFFGVGFLGLLPAAPATALASAPIFRAKLSAAARTKDTAKVKGFGAGLLTAAVIWAFLLGNVGLAYLGCVQGLSPDPAVAAHGVRLARMSSRTDIIRKVCNERGRIVLRFIPIAKTDASSVAEPKYLSHAGLGRMGKVFRFRHTRTPSPNRG